MRQLELDKTGVLEAELSAGTWEQLALTRGGEVIAVVMTVDELAAMKATQRLFATNGALAAIAEGSADVAAGRSDDWASLRTDYGRGDPDAPRPASRVSVSHRARWDLELLLPAAAHSCFDLLDRLIDSDMTAPGQRLTAGFTDLGLHAAEGYRMVFRAGGTGAGLAVIHVDADAGVDGAA